RHRGRDLLRGRVRAADEVLVEDEAAEPERAPGPHRATHGAEREHVDVRAAELEALRKERLEPDLPRPVVQADDQVAPPARPRAAREVGGEARILAPECLRVAARMEQRTGFTKVGGVRPGAPYEASKAVRAGLHPARVGYPHDLR